MHRLNHSDHFYLKDLKSRNGTLVNGRRITQMHVLHHGDEIVISKSIFRFLTSTSGVVQHSRTRRHMGGYYAVPNDVAGPMIRSSTKMLLKDSSFLVLRNEYGSHSPGQDCGRAQVSGRHVGHCVFGDQNAKLRLLLQGLSALRGAVERPAIFCTCRGTAVVGVPAV